MPKKTSTKSAKSPKTAAKPRIGDLSVAAKKSGKGKGEEVKGGRHMVYTIRQ